MAINSQHLMSVFLNRPGHKVNAVAGGTELITEDEWPVSKKNSPMAFAFGVRAWAIRNRLDPLMHCCCA